MIGGVKKASDNSSPSFMRHKNETWTKEFAESLILAIIC